jgi:hypothetical protein
MSAPGCSITSGIQASSSFDGALYFGAALI